MEPERRMKINTPFPYEYLSDRVTHPGHYVVDRGAVVGHVASHIQPPFYFERRGADRTIERNGDVRRDAKPILALVTLVSLEGHGVPTSVWIDENQLKDDNV
jgi:hypothetical protein